MNSTMDCENRRIDQSIESILVSLKLGKVYERTTNFQIEWHHRNISQSNTPPMMVWLVKVLAVKRSGKKVCCVKSSDYLLFDSWLPLAKSKPAGQMIASPLCLDQISHGI